MKDREERGRGRGKGRGRGRGRGRERERKGREGERERGTEEGREGGRENYTLYMFPSAGSSPPTPHLNGSARLRGLLFMRTSSQR